MIHAHLITFAALLGQTEPGQAEQGLVEQSLAQPETTGMTVGGIVIMTISIGLVVGLLAFCIQRILRSGDAGK